MPLSPVEHRALKAQAHALNPVVIIGDAGLKPSVLKEIDRALTAHELIKVRYVTDERDERTAALAKICEELNAEPVQHIGKLLVLYRHNPELHKTDILATLQPKSGKKVAAKKIILREEAKRNPITGKLFILKTSTRTTHSEARPPRTERIRKSGQKSSKKGFQNN